MKLTLVRGSVQGEALPGKLYIDGRLWCLTLERSGGRDTCAMVHGERNRLSSFQTPAAGGEQCAGAVGHTLPCRHQTPPLVGMYPRAYTRGGRPTDRTLTTNPTAT